MRKLVLGVAVAAAGTGLLLNSLAADAVPVQWSGNGHWYEGISVPGGISWTNAKVLAEQKGGYLATITSAAERDFVYSVASTDDSLWHWLTSSPLEGVGPWLGGYQYDKLAEPAGHWRWVTGETWSYTAWSSGEPNDWNGVEEYLVFGAVGQLKAQTWNDTALNGWPAYSGEVRGYVIEYVPEPSTLVLLGVGVIGLLGWLWRKQAGRVVLVLRGKKSIWLNWQLFCQSCGTGRSGEQPQKTLEPSITVARASRYTQHSQESKSMKRWITTLAALMIVISFGVKVEANIVTNGNFTEGDYRATDAGGSDFATLPVGATNLVGWTIVGDNQDAAVDWVKTYWQQPNANSFSLDLSGEAAGGISQDLTLTEGVEYSLRFALAGNSYFQDDLGYIKRLKVSVGNLEPYIFDFDATDRDPTNMGWVYVGVNFVANATSMKLSFQSLNNSPAGPALGDVSVTPVPEPSTIALLGMGAVGLVGWAWRKRAYSKLSSTLSVAALVVFAAGTAQAVVTIDTVPVGNAGNAADDTGYGAVAYAYNIGKYEVTAGQYTEFLNAKAATDTYALYKTNMADYAYGCGITQSGSSGSYSYSVAAGMVNHPVNYVSFWDAARFANWLHNGQGNGDTENGAYTLTTGGISANTIVRNAEAKWWVPSEDEWYKAAYHKNNGVTGGVANYFNYPTSSDIATTTAQANIYGAVYPSDTPPYTTDVGTFSASPSPYGTFDQGGNVWEWNDSIISGSSHGFCGGSFDGNAIGLASSYHGYQVPTIEDSDLGFRVASVPEPGSITLLVAGAIAGLVWWRKRKTA